jgi:UDP-N-acetylglucosamine--N-acetylmuramyl-(pentapeptide) pyrophosphoryl-undecaprenol N-acetylglucosamine transferase
MKKRIVIAAGGSGGHLYPAMATAEELLSTNEAEILFVGAGLDHNRFFQRDLYQHVDVPSGSNIKTIYPLIKGITRSIKILKDFRADVAVGFGSYHSLPPLLAGKVLGIPIALHEANSIPGKVVRLLSRFASVTGVQFPDAAKSMSGNVHEIPLPLRKGYHKNQADRTASARYYGIDPNIPTVLIFGGSQGAQAINGVVDAELLHTLKKGMGACQILHFSGGDTDAQRLRELYKNCEIQAVVKTHEPFMNYAWACCDLAVTRAGASTIAEQLAFEIPAVYIPYPGAADNHQYLNALFVVNEVKGGDLLLQEQMNSPVLAQKILAILSKEEHKSNLIHHIQSYKQRHCKQTLSEWILRI